MIYKKLKFLLLGLFLLGIINMPSFLNAESQIDVGEEDVYMETSPNNPKPYEDVSISLSSYVTDLNKAVITWQIGADTVLSGVGKTSYSFKVGGPDIKNTVTINIRPAGSTSTITKVVSIIPQDIEMMWEAVGEYTPPFYKGKSLPTKGGLIKVIAIPSSNTITSGSGSITYTWKNNDEAMPDNSGYDKNYYIFKSSLLNKSNEITVTASSVNDNYKAENSISVPFYQPKMVFYKKSPTDGILYNNAITNGYFLNEDEITIKAEPYFMVLSDSNNFVLWRINDKPVETTGDKTEITLRPNSRGGYATIGLTIENSDELYQKVNNLIKINL